MRKGVSAAYHAVEIWTGDLPRQPKGRTLRVSKDVEPNMGISITTAKELSYQFLLL